ncbi:hypothetical protein [Desulfogranum japonicum]|uniref:hypothetical protein n=1 Tax=Desulfogranum japonicum TaxID=231447 RepID=UPI0004016446|nr:hypothetical protein [Desulfogranum japonicum]
MYRLVYCTGAVAYSVCLVGVGNQTHTKHELAPIQVEIRRLEAIIATLSRRDRLPHASAVFRGRR